MRLGRLRPADVLLLVLGGALAVGVVAGSWLGGGGVFSDLFGSDGVADCVAAWFAFGVAAIGVLEFAQTVSRRAPTGGLAACVALCAIAPIAFWVAVAGNGEAPLLIGLAAIFVCGVWGLRDESRGFQPDSAGPVTLLDLPGRSADSLDG